MAVHIEQEGRRMVVSKGPRDHRQSFRDNAMMAMRIRYGRTVTSVRKATLDGGLWGKSD